MTVEEYLKDKNITIEVNGIKINLTTSKDFEMLLTDYHESQLKANMPTEQKIEKAFGMMLTRTENDQNFDSGVKEGIKWLKQQIIKS